MQNLCCRVRWIDNEGVLNQPMSGQCITLPDNDEQISRQATTGLNQLHLNKYITNKQPNATQDLIKLVNQRVIADPSSV